MHSAAVFQGPSPLVIATFCEGPDPLFAKGLFDTIADNPDFMLEFASDINKESVDGWCWSIHGQVRDATQAESFANLDVACVIAPYADKRIDTDDLIAGIAKAAKDSKVPFLILGSRHQPTGRKEYGKPELYQAFCDELELKCSVRPVDDISICPGYKHYNTAGWQNRGGTLDNLKRH
ncbi:hypothetical protein HMI55_005046, partial [Coelomomyces lativittatus]